MIGDGGGKILWSEFLEVCEVKRTNGCAMVFKYTDGKTAEFVVFRQFSHIIDKRIITKFQPSELPCGKYDKIALMSITTAGLYINDIMEVSIISCFYFKTAFYLTQKLYKGTSQTISKPFDNCVCVICNYFVNTTFKIFIYENCWTVI